MKKKSLILAEGEVDEEIYFLQDGIIRLFYSDNSRDFNVIFYTDNQIFSSFISFHKSIPSPLSLQALVKSNVLKISKKDLYELYDRNQKFERLARLVTEFLLVDMLEKYMELISMKTQERYEKLVEQWGEQKIKKISIKNLASYLRIEPESLSRIRKNYKKKKI